MVRKTKIAPPPPLPGSIYNQRNEEDKLPPPEDMSVEPEFMRAKKIAEKEMEEETAQAVREETVEKTFADSGYDGDEESDFLEMEDLEDER